MTTDAVAKALEDHPARVRQIVAGLVRGGLLQSLRGANGGVALARPAAQITLRDIFNATEERGMLGVGLRANDADGVTATPLTRGFQALFAELETMVLQRLENVTLDRIGED